MKIEIVKTDSGHYLVEIVRGDRRLAVRAYNPTERRDADEFARQLYLVTGAESWSFA